MVLSDAIKAVGEMLKAFPNGHPQDPTGYIGALANVLIEYPRAVAMRCADQKHGLARSTRFLPTVADIVAWCERETAEMRKPVEREDRDIALREQSRRLEAEERHWEADRATRPTLQQLQEKHGPNWGIKQDESEDPRVRDQRQRQLAEANERALLAEYQAAGLEPVRAVDGTLISLSLTKLLRQTEEHKT